MALAVLVIGLRCDAHGAPRARLPRGYAAPEGRGGQPRRTPVIVLNGGV
jgi:hypothetical protein